MVKVAATPADVFRQHILEAVRRMEFDDDPWLEGLGVDVEEDMTSIKGRCLFSILKLGYFKDTFIQGEFCQTLRWFTDTTNRLLSFLRTVFGMSET